MSVGRDSEIGAQRTAEVWVLVVLLLLLTVIPAEYSRRIISEYAGVPTIPVEGGRWMRLAPSQGEPLLDAQELVVREDGALLVADPGHSRVALFEPGAASGRVLVDVPGDPADIRLESLALSPRGELWVLQRKTGVVQLYDQEGALLREGKQAPFGASRLATDHHGNLYLAANRGGIYKLTPSLQAVESWGSQLGTPGVVSITGVAGLAVGAAGVFVTSNQPSALTCLDLDGNEVGRRLLRSEPGILGLGSDGLIYMSDQRYHRVWVFDADCREIGRLVQPTSETGFFTQARGVGVVGDSLYIVHGGAVRHYRFLAKPEIDAG